MSLQAVLFNKNYNSPREANKWLREHQLRPIKSRHTTVNFHRYRIAPPTGQMRMMTLDPKKRIKAVIMVGQRGQGVTHRSGPGHRPRQGGARVIYNPARGSLHMPTARFGRQLYRRRGGAIGSDLGIGAAVVGSILAGILGKKIYDHVKRP